jgi:hypothetical protein
MDKSFILSRNIADNLIEIENNQSFRTALPSDEAGSLFHVRF